MIITVTLNAAIDRTLSVPSFRLGRRHRTVEQRTMAGGKGVNIARTLKSLGQPVIATGFAALIRALHKPNIPTAVDADGDPLRLAVRAEPDVVSPNVLEAEELVGHEFNDDEDRTIAVREMVQLGAREAIMTVHDGCFALLHCDGAPCLFRIWIEPREPIAAVGSGEAFLAGYVSARYSGQAPDDCLRFGVACGTDSTQQLGAGVLDPRGVEKLLGEVEVHRLAMPAEVG